MTDEIPEEKQEEIAADLADGSLDADEVNADDLDGDNEFDEGADDET